MGKMRSSAVGSRDSARQPTDVGIDLCLVLEQRDPAEVARTAAAAARHQGAFLVVGAHPDERSDLPLVIDVLAQQRPERLGMRLSGESVDAELLRALRAGGLRRLLVPFHCARQDAHDWVAGHAGALKAADRTIRLASEQDLPVVAEVFLTRPTLPHLGETIEVLARRGVRQVWVRRLTELDVSQDRFVALSPRFALLEAALEEAAAVALRRQIRLRLRDLPVCVAPRLRSLFAPADAERWVTADGSVQPRSEETGRCDDCPGPPQCAGMATDYGTRFGWEEAVSPRFSFATRTAGDPVPAEGTELVFSWRGPQRLRCEACGDEPSARAESVPSGEPTRGVRARLVQAARFAPTRLRIVGADVLAHPRAAALLYDALRLFPAVEAAGEASAIVDWSELELRRVKGLRRIDVAIYGPDAARHDAHCGIPGSFAAMQRAVERLREETEIAVGGYAVLHESESLADFAAAWEQGLLPGTPRFRLSAHGGSLDDLLRAAQALPIGPARAAIEALLPACMGPASDRPEAANRPVKVGHVQHVMRYGRREPYRPCGSDPIGSFEACQPGEQRCSIPGCPGRPSGWSSTRSTRWTMTV